MIDWERIKTAYLTENLSYGKVAEKFHVTVRTVEKRGAAEGWVALRKQREAELQRKILQEADEDTRQRAHRLQTVADQMLDKVAQTLNERETLSGTELRNLAGTLKSIKDIQMIQSPLDEKEQKIKIANLEKQMEKGKDEGIAVVLEGELKDYAL